MRAWAQRTEAWRAKLRSHRCAVQRTREPVWAGVPLRGNLLRDSVQVDPARARDQDSTAESLRMMDIVQRVGMPLLAGTDLGFGGEVSWRRLSGFALHAELAMMVAEGLTPLNALQSATLNPAKLLHATDSLGTVAPGKLADLVLLDADPLADITNTTTIRAVVANGRYFDRAALDGLLTEVRMGIKTAEIPSPIP
jgi:imidazolonepropionase-like amidohydrolase